MKQRSYRNLPWGAALLVSVVLVGLGTPTHTDLAIGAPQIAEGVTPAASCAAVGTYFVGPRILPMQRSASSSAAIVWPGYALRGTLTITDYTPCGTPTRGSFSVSRVAYGPPIERPGHSSGAPVCVSPCVAQVPGVLKATGDFAADPLHAGAATYVTVTATVTTARLGPVTGRTCVPGYPCLPQQEVITTTQSFTDVTGYLQIGTAQAETATLAFLPPPVDAMTPPALLVLQGRRSGAAGVSRQ